MLPTRFIWRLYAGYILLILLASLTAVMLVSRSVQQDSRSEIEQTLLGEAYLIREVALPALKGADPAALQDRVKALGRETRTRFTIIALDGQVLADSEEDPARMDPHHTRPEVLDARSRGRGTVSRYSQTLRAEMLYLALPAYDEERLLGYVRAALPLDKVEHRLASARRSILLGAGLASVLALLIGIVLARRATFPLRSMTRAAKDMAEGKSHGRVPETRGSVEMRDLAAAFNSMGEQLQERLEAIAGERNKLAAILAGMSEGVLAVDDQERILHVNDLGAELLRLEIDRDLGRPVWECSRVAEACELVGQALKENRFLRREITQVGGPRQRIIELKASPLPGEGPRPAGAVLVLNEVTELRQLEAMRRDFIANASHELKTPLTVIRGLAETLHEDPEMSGETRARFVDKLNRQVGRLAGLVSDLLSLSRLEDERGHFEMGPLDLGELAVECAMGQQGVAEDKGIDLVAEPPEGPLPIKGDRSALRQTLDNLLDNALKYTPEGGQVRVEALAESGHIVVIVDDTGIGIEPEDQARIFERFYRVDKARSRELGGTGLGLSIVKHTVLGHGGEISVESDPGRGSRFRLRIPQAG